MDTLVEIKRVLTLEGEAIIKFEKSLNSKANADSLRSALEILQKTLERDGKIIITGVGKSGKIAQKIAATFLSTGSFAVFLHPTEGLHGDLGLVSSRDAVLALSYTGNTEELLRLVPSLKKNNIPLIGMGGNGKSQLSEACDVWIQAEVEQEACPHNLAPTTSTTLMLAIGDALAVTLMGLRGFDAASFARNHPGGSLGRRLHLTVNDVMHKGEAVACVKTSSSMDEVVIASTEKKLGAVLVVEGKKLVGLITDGDLRRALQHREKFFTLRAAEVMTRDPVSVHPEMMAADALELMENRPSQIKELPVVDSQKNWLGVVRIHDLVRAL